jgi:hypothetical protein
MFFNTLIHYHAYEEVRQYLGIMPSEINPKDLGAGICWGTIIPENDIINDCIQTSGE